MSNPDPPRLPRDLRPNRLTVEIRRVHAAGRRPIDLTLTNPTIAGFHYPPDLLQPLASGDALVYDPEPFGARAARDAIAADYRRRGIVVAPEHVVLTTSTSEAYSFLFKLLCRPAGDSVLVPTPSYPLFDHLTALDGVRATPYALEYHGRWTLDPSALDDVWDASVRAVLVVSPNNPTGSEMNEHEVGALADRCARRRAALIVDEVFADYPLDPAVGHRAGTSGLSTSLSSCLTFRLGGLSKSAGLPQVKLGWIVVDGPRSEIEEALRRLEVICDAYLSVSTPVQVAAPALIAAGAAVRAQILGRIRTNHATLAAIAADHPAIDVLPVDAGWSAVIRVPAVRTEEDLVLALLQRDDVLVHPGFFFDFPHEAFVVVSLLPEPAVFDEGIRRVMERASA
jgi:alanine-synthesizing transaminase